jgi:hypothetical protein
MIGSADRIEGIVTSPTHSTIRRPVDIPHPEVGKPAAWSGSNAGSRQGDSPEELPATAKALHPPTTGHPARITALVTHKTPNGPLVLFVMRFLRRHIRYSGRPL